MDINIDRRKEAWLHDFRESILYHAALQRLEKEIKGKGNKPRKKRKCHFSAPACLIVCIALSELLFKVAVSVDHILRISPQAHWKQFWD